MCQIIFKEAGKKFNFEAMDKAQHFNKDGYGVMWYEDNVVKTYKTMSYKTFKKVLEAIEGKTCVAHLRHTTVGKTNIANCHPFDVPTGQMMHNGTIFSLNSSKNGKSDSQRLADMISECHYESIDCIEPMLKHVVGSTINRLVFMEDDGNVTIINEHLGMWEEGVWYSNDYHKKADGWCRAGSCYVPPKKDSPSKNNSFHTVDLDDDSGIYGLQFEDNELEDKQSDELSTVFVYGTLKRGYTNHYLLRDAIFLGKATTKDKWAMIGEGRPFPYVLMEDEDKGHNIKGEVYKVTPAQKKSLDHLEGVPLHYHEQEVEVVYDDDTSDLVSMYIKTRIVDELLEEPFIESFTA